jgi:hypothetical protein
MAILINENVVRKIVKEALNSMLLMEFDVKKGMGSKGPITEADLLTPSEFLASTCELYKKCLRVPIAKRKKLNIDKIFQNDPGYQIWKNYVVDMLGSYQTTDGDIDDEGDVIKKPVLTGFKPQDKEQKFPKYARDFFGWLRTVTSDKPSRKYLAFKYGDNYIFGHWKQGYFIAAYISTGGSFRGLASMIAELSKYSNIIFAVTLDMADMLERIGLLSDGKIHMVPFAGHQVEKKIFATTPQTLFIANLAHQMAGNKRGRKRMPKQF